MSEKDSQVTPLPHKATTAALTTRLIHESESIQHYLSQLAPDEREGFLEIAHHLVHCGFEDGLRRPIPQLTPAQLALSGTRLLEIYLKGAAEGELILDEYYSNED